MKKSISGIRGIFGEDFTLKDVLKFCNSFSSLIDSKTCVIAHDTRPSSKMIVETAMAALLQNGIDVYNIGVSATPIIFREARKYGSGLMITASHNPIQWNGLKFIVNGRGINEEELKVVLCDKKPSVGNIGKENFIESNYVNEALEIIEKTNNTPKVTLDAGGGAAAEVAPNLLRKLGCDVQVINESIENSTRGPDPTLDNLENLIKNTLHKDIGFAFDLDGDRLVVVKDGKKLSPDVTLGLGVAKSLEMGYKKFVLSIDTSVSIEKFIKLRNGKVTRSKVGEANVVDEILKTNSEAGGEGSSGGFILPEFNYCRDGILTSGLIASMVGTKIVPEILDFMDSYYQLRDKIKIDSNFHDKTLNQVHEKIKKDYSEIIAQDGLKAILDEDSWILIRKSNTEDIIRISVESKNKEKNQRLNDQLKDLVKQCYDKIK